MNRGSLSFNPICLSPPEQSISKFLTESGTFKDGDLRVNKDGIQTVSQSEPGAPPPIEPLDNQLSLTDVEVIKVIGKDAFSCFISGHSIEHRRINMSGDFSGAENKLNLAMSISREYSIFFLK